MQLPTPQLFRDWAHGMDIPRACLAGLLLCAVLLCVIYPLITSSELRQQHKDRLAQGVTLFVAFAFGWMLTRRYGPEIEKQIREVEDEAES